RGGRPARAGEGRHLPGVRRRRRTAARPHAEEHRFRFVSARKRNLSILGVVALALVLALLIDIPGAPLAQKTRLGLDLKGGVELIYQGRPTPQVPKVTPEAVRNAIETIRKRTDALGVSEPEIQQAGTDQISIGLPAGKNAARAEQQVGTSATRAARGHSSGKPAKGTACPATLKSLADKGVGPAAGSLVVKVPRGIVVVKGEQRGKSKGTLGYWVLEDDSELSGSDIKDPKQAFDPQTNEPIVTFNFTDKGRAAFARATKREADRGAQILRPPGTDIH